MNRLPSIETSGRVRNSDCSIRTGFAFCIALASQRAAPHVARPERHAAVETISRSLPSRVHAGSMCMSVDAEVQPVAREAVVRRDSTSSPAHCPFLIGRTKTLKKPFGLRRDVGQPRAVRREDRIGVDEAVAASARATRRSRR